METITGRSNQHLKFARRVRGNNVDGKFLVEGKRLAEELLHSEIRVEAVFVTQEFASSNKELVDRFDENDAGIFLLSENLLESISDTKSPQGISLLCDTPRLTLEDLDNIVGTAQNSIVLLLHRINNPGNLGAVLRSAEAFGVTGAVVTENSANAFSPAAVRGSMGSVFRLPVIGDVDFASALDWARKAGLSTVCADVNGDTKLDRMAWQTKTMIVFGSEAHGLEESERKEIDQSFKINIQEPVESLNLAVAAGIVLYSARLKQGDQDYLPAKHAK